MAIDGVSQFVLAMGTPPGAGVNPLIQLVPIAAVFAIFYFIILLPTRKKQKQLDEFHRGLKVGDRVRLLSFGSVGIVNHIKDDEAEVRVGSLRMREKLDNLELVYKVGARRNEVSTGSGSDRVNTSHSSLLTSTTTRSLPLPVLTS